MSAAIDLAPADVQVAGPPPPDAHGGRIGWLRTLHRRGSRSARSAAALVLLLL